MAAGSDPAPEESLKRLGGGRWQTRDERFTIEPQSGTWAVVDGEETDDLGLPLVRGPFRSLTDAKAAIAAARTTEAPASPLAERLERRRSASSNGSKADREAPATSGRGARAATDGDETTPGKGKPARQAPSKARPPKAQEPDEPEEPGWLRDLTPPERGRARRLIEQLTGSGETDAVGIVRRDLVGGVPAIAAHALATRLAALPADASPGTVAELLADGRDESLGVRWRIVDGDGRPIVIDLPRAARRKG